MHGIRLALLLVCPCLCVQVTFIGLRLSSNAVFIGDTDSPGTLSSQGMHFDITFASCEVVYGAAVNCSNLIKSTVQAVASLAY